MKIVQLLNRDTKWCQHALARDGNGKPINCLDVLYLDQGRRTLDLAKNAKSFSLYGAICHCYGEQDHEQVADKIHEGMRKVLGKDPWIAEFNDDEKTTFEDVKAVIQAAGV
jgi:hypothetical protein